VRPVALTFPSVTRFELPPDAPPLAIPPTELIERVAGTPDPEWFVRSGRISVQELARTLGIAGRTLESFDSLLDFVCGRGRMLRWHGLSALPDERTDLRAALERGGIVFLDGTASPTLGLPDWYQTTFHTPWYVYEHWGRWFEIRAHVPGGSLAAQDHVLLERRPDDDPPRPPLAARPMAAGGPLATDVVDPLLAARRDRERAATARSRLGSAGVLLRRAVLRLLRPYTAHEDRFDDAVTDAVRALDAARLDHEHRIDRLERRR
jgi:hypothetical protein